jgi:hypothetical protein
MIAGYGNGTFNNESHTIAGAGAQFVVTGDFNGDGIADVAVVNSSANSIYIYTAVTNGATLAPEVWPSTSSINFGNFVPGGTSRRELVQVHYTGKGPLAINSITVPAGFTQANNCAASLPAGANCTIAITAMPNPASIGGPMTLTYNGSHHAAAQLSAPTVASLLSANPLSVNFGTVIVGTVINPIPVTVSNSGAQSVAVSISFTDIEYGPAFGEADNCALLAAGATCTIEVSFAIYDLANTSTATMVVSGGGSNIQIPVSGAGYLPPYGPKP